jgi:hypothetical protein
MQSVLVRFYRCLSVFSSLVSHSQRQSHESLLSFQESFPTSISRVTSVIPTFISNVNLPSHIRHSNSHFQLQFPESLFSSLLSRVIYKVNLPSHILVIFNVSSSISFLCHFLSTPMQLTLTQARFPPSESQLVHCIASYFTSSTHIHHQHKGLDYSMRWKLFGLWVLGSGFLMHPSQVLGLQGKVLMRI